MPFLVMTPDSDSEDEIEILSEKITNYRNISASLEITPEVEEKIHRSLEKYAPFHGKIKVIKAYTIRKTTNSVGTVSASIVSTNGQGAQVINIGPASAFFKSPVRGRANDNSKNKRARPVTNISEKVTSEKCFPQSLPTDTEGVKVQVSSSSVLHNSPIRKVKVQRLRTKQRVPPNISQTFGDEIVAEENSKYERNLTKNVEMNENRHQESSHLNQELSKQKMKNVFSRRNARGEIESVAKCNIQLSSENNDKKDDPRLSSNTSSPSPSSPPTEAWMSFITLSQLSPAEFGAVARLCEVETVAQARKRINGPMRVFRKRPKK